MTTAVASPSSSLLMGPSAAAQDRPYATSSNFFVSAETSPRGRPQHKASESTNTFLSSPSPSPTPASRIQRGPQNPVQYATVRSTAESPLPTSPPPFRAPNFQSAPAAQQSPVLKQQNHQQHQYQYQPQPQVQSQPERREHYAPQRHRSRSRSQQASPQPIYASHNGPMALMQPDMTPLSFSRSPKRKRRSSSQSNICMPSSGDPGCMAVFLGPKHPRRRRSSSDRGRPQTRVEERDSLLADFQGYEREDSPRTTVSKRMSDLGLLDPAPHHKRDPSTFSNGGHDVVTNAISEETEPESAPEISPHHVASQQALPKLQTSGSSQRHDKYRHDQDSERKASETSDQSLSKRINSARTSYSLFPSSSDSPVSPMSPQSSKAFSEYAALRRSNSSPRRQTKSPSPPLGPRPVSPSRQASLSTSNSTRKSSAPVPRHAKSSAHDLRRRAPSPPLTAGAEDPLVWHDSEITGHLMMDPDDDGTGINGVGFKPSKVEEEVRRMKRRQQVEAWKAREGRAERDERMRRRRHADTESPPAAEDGEKRFVRFAEE